MIDEIDVIGMRESKQFSIKSIFSINYKFNTPCQTKSQTNTTTCVSKPIGKTFGFTRKR